MLPQSLRHAHSPADSCFSVILGLSQGACCLEEVTEMIMRCVVSVMRGHGHMDTMGDLDDGHGHRG